MQDHGNDYLQVNFAGGKSFIKISFEKDQTYVIGYNFINYEFMYKTNIMIRQYPVININKLAGWLTEWLNRLNK